MEDITSNYEISSVILTLTIAFAFMFLLLYIASTIAYPAKPIKLLRQKLGLTPSTLIDEQCTNKEIFRYSQRVSHTLYYLEKNEPSTDTIIIDLPGGAFLSSSNTLIYYKYMNQPHTVVSIEYPVLPNGTYDLTMRYISKVLDYLLNSKYVNHKVIIIAASAGCYYATKLINNGKFNDRIHKVVFMSGYFGYDTIPNIYTYVTETLYLHHSLRRKSEATCIPLPAHIQAFYAVGANDPLKISSYEFLKQSGEGNKVVSYPNSEHCFYLRYNNTATKTFYNDLENFITQN